MAKRMTKKTRKSHRKGTRMATRRMRRMRGGFIQMNPADVNDTSMDASSKLNLMQGQGYANVHKEQHGGAPAPAPAAITAAPAPMAAMTAAPTPVAATLSGVMARVPVPAPAQHGGEAPVGDTGVLDPALSASARVAPLDASFAAIQGMKDQGGGRRRGRKSKSRKSKKVKKVKKVKSRRSQRGGWAPIEEPTMMLPTDMGEKAVQGMNPEWLLAENPASFTPSK